MNHKTVNCNGILRYEQSPDRRALVFPKLKAPVMRK